MTLLSINGKDLVRSVKAGCINLERNRDKVDMLNVFPVPDGDTGTNMYLTILSAVKEGEKVSEDSIKFAAKKISMGALMGARGNSGVIMSQIFRGMAKVFENKDQVDSLELAMAFKSGAQTAYEAVMKPVEGTILTVVREIAKSCEYQAKNNEDIITVLREGLRRGYLTLEKTPTMLPILREAGVVDAGGQGFLFFLEGMIIGLGQDEQAFEALKPETSGRSLILNDNTDYISLDFQYCTELLIKGERIDLQNVKNNLEPLGDSMLVVGEPDLVKVHIHSNHPGKVLENCLQWGDLLDVKINNMLEEVHEHIQNWEIQKEDTPEKRTPLKKIGVVAVSLGDGLDEVLTSLGADVVVPGGQTMNPSTEDLLNACTQVQAEKILILPNNGNVVMAAEQAARMLPDQVLVLPTKSILQGISAMINYEPEGTLSEVLDNMRESLENARYAEVTYAVRDININGLDIQTGDNIGLIEGNISAQGDSPEAVMEDLLRQMVREETQLINVFYGEGISEEQADDIKNKLTAIYDECEVEFAYGGQPFYSYLILLE
ncbi:MAG: DAK2 domain-containing protein [Syntrophomonadaceae bacterium]|nr:DAK2 domain-containing protein [Syntrophomonadaceae bacterium]